MSEIKEVKLEPLARLHFDPKNPRLPSSVIDGTDETAVIDWMLTDASLIELMGSIGMQGFFPAEPLLVIPHPEATGHFLVIEGNRRLAAAKLLQSPGLATKRVASVTTVAEISKYHPPELPVFVYQNRESILQYLGFRHITGVKPWSPLAKAKYLKELKASFSSLSLREQYERLAQAIGNRSDYVQHLLVGLSLFDFIQSNDYFDIPNLNEKDIDFGVYYNAIRWPNIREYIGLDFDSQDPSSELKKSRVKELTKWISERNSQNKTVLGESRNLKLLDSILGNEKATKEFRDGMPIRKAVKLSEDVHTVFSESIHEALASLNTANEYVHSVEDLDEADEKITHEAKSISNGLHLIVKDKVRGETE